MKQLTLALGLGVLLAGSQQPTAKLPASEANKLRTLYGQALAEGGSKAKSQLVALAERLEPKYAHEELVAALREGPLLTRDFDKPRKQGKQPEELHAFGRTTVGFSFSCAAGVFRYAVDVPRSYDPLRPAAVLLDPGHGTGKGKSDEEKAQFLEFYRRQCDAAGLEDWLVARTEIIEQVGAGGLRGALPEDQIASIFEAFWRDLSSRWSVDPDRLYVAGLSQTGFWAWYLGRANAQRLAGIAPMSSVTWQVDKYLENFAKLPCFVLHGAEDEVCAVAQPRATCAALRQLGAPVEYVEVAGSAHDGKTWGRLNEALVWLSQRPRNTYPSELSRSLATLENPWCGWLRLEELERSADGKASSGPTAKLRAVIQGQELRLTSSGVKRVTLFVEARMLDLRQPIEVFWNEKLVHQGRLKPSFGTTIEAALEKADWKQVFDAKLSLRCP